jgi:hypothetical protein
MLLRLIDNDDLGRGRVQRKEMLQSLQKNPFTPISWNDDG